MRPDIYLEVYQEYWFIVVVYVDVVELTTAHVLHVSFPYVWMHAQF